MADVSETARRFTEKRAAQAKNVFNQASAATAEGTRRAENSALAAASGLAEYSRRALEMAQENTTAGLEFARELASVKKPLEFIHLWSARSREWSETFLEQTKELGELAQKAVTYTAARSRAV